MCRQPWQGDGNAHEALAKGEVGNEGYVNVGSQLGMSGHRGMWYPYPNFGEFSLTYIREQIRLRTIRTTHIAMATARDGIEFIFRSLLCSTDFFFSLRQPVSSQVTHHYIDIWRQFTYYVLGADELGQPCFVWLRGDFSDFKLSLPSKNKFVIFPEMSLGD